ncbi:MAG: aminoglycoside phosphotransferase family protein [Chloroflexota bacterium]|nr:aminoglycoside phosphotransferase family protein [Chloroflexota bacterium]
MSCALRVPAAFARCIRDSFGADGQVWLQGLAALLADLAAEWELSIGAPFELSYNYVVAAKQRDGTPAVLKIGVPRAEIRREQSALSLYAGDGACRVIRSDFERCAMLLERVEPGEMLVRLVRADDEQATRIGARLLRKLWRPVPAEACPTLRPVSEWFAAFDRHRQAYDGPGPLPRRVFDAGVAAATTLLDSAPAPVLLHGDFHHYNVLSARREDWLAIDPKGMTGDRGYDVGPFMCNPRPSDGPLSPAMLQRRLDILAEELEYDRARLRDWSIAHAVLSACWSAEDHSTGWQAAVNVAEMLLASSSPRSRP